MAKRQNCFVARLKGQPQDAPAYAREGYETGMGRTIEDGPLSIAKRVHSPAALMAWLGGHYRGYEAVELEVSYKVGKVCKWPSEDSVFDR